MVIKNKFLKFNACKIGLLEEMSMVELRERLEELKE